MRLRDLPAQRETDSRAAGFGCKEWNEKIRRVHDARTGIADKNFDAFWQITPAGGDRSFCFERRFGGVVKNVDEQLFQLRGVRFDRHIRSWNNADRNSRLKTRHSFDELAEIDRFLLRLWQSRQPRIRLHETAQRFRPRRENIQSTSGVVTPVGRRRILLRSEE